MRKLPEWGRGAHALVKLNDDDIIKAIMPAEQSSTGISAMKTRQNSREIFLLGCFLDRWANDNVGTFGSRNRSCDHDHSLFTPYLKDAKVLDSALLITHVSRHAHVFPNTTWSGAVTDGAISTMHRGTVGHWLTCKIVTLDRALETFSFGLTDDVHELTNFEVGDRKFGAFRSHCVVSETELTNEPLGSGIRFGEMWYSKFHTLSMRARVLRSAECLREGIK